MIAVTLLLALSTSAAIGQTSATRAPDCQQWTQCRDLTVGAIAAGDFEHAHDLAWRAVQLGPRGNLDLMYLLARAQSLSGRPHDALVMLGRLLDAGFKPDITDDAFRAVRSLREWPQLEARLTGSPRPAEPSGVSAPGSTVGAPGSAVSAPGSASGLDASATPERRATPASPDAAPSAVGGSPSTASAGIEEALRLPAGTLHPTGLAYDSASARFVVADRQRERLVILDERSHHVVDLVRSSSAGFYDITGFEIDPRQGDLWVVSAESGADDGQRATALHKLQLVSGRPLFLVRVPDDLLPARLEDVAVSSHGAVFVLDTIGKRILRLQPSSRSFAVAAALDVDRPASIAPMDDHVVYVAHAGGILRVDASAGTAVPLRGGPDVQLSGFERIRAEGQRLFGIQRLAGGVRRAVSIRLSGTQATAIDVIASSLIMSDPSAAALSGDTLYVLTRVSAGNVAEDEIVVGRLRLDAIK